MTTATALAGLPPAWQHWIKDNLARGCEPVQLADIMVRDGRFDRALARIAVEDARGGPAKTPEQAPPPAPRIETRAGTLLCADRTVDVLLSMRSPEIVLLGNFLSAQECEELIAHAEPKLSRSPVVADGNGQQQIHAHRTSRGAMLQRGENALVARIEARIAALVAWPVERGEGLQLLRYAKGDEYRPHFDWFDPAMPGPARHLAQGGQRVATLIMYLNDVEEGGATVFPEAGLEILPRRGTALFFSNLDPEGRPDRRALHGGAPVGTGVKFIATKWLRERPY